MNPAPPQHLSKKTRVKNFQTRKILTKKEKYQCEAPEINVGMGQDSLHKDGKSSFLFFFLSDTREYFNRSNQFKTLLERIGNIYESLYQCSVHAGDLSIEPYSDAHQKCSKWSNIKVVAQGKKQNLIKGDIFFSVHFLFLLFSLNLSIHFCGLTDS